VTQEKLADALGVTSQAVSRWESETGYPDIEYITPLANYFNVTIDELFGHDLAGKRRRIDEICEEYDGRYDDVQYDYETRVEMMHKRVDTMRRAVAEFPAEEQLLYRLAQALYEKFEYRGFKMLPPDENGDEYHDHEWYRSSDGWVDWDECAKIMEDLLQTSHDDFIRTSCLQSLAYIYSKVGEKEKCEEKLNKLASMSSLDARMVRLAAASGAERKMMERSAMLLYFNDFRMMLMLVTKRQGAEIHVQGFKFLFDIHEFISRYGNKLNYHVTLRDMYIDYAEALAALDEPRTDEAFAALDSAYEHAIAFDEEVYQRDLEDARSEGVPEIKKVPKMSRLLMEHLQQRRTESAIYYKSFAKISGDPRYGALIARIEAELDT
jgi:transcriptional regulator with XRE-family HTH domain